MQIDDKKLNALVGDVTRARRKALEGYTFSKDRAFIPEVGATYEIHFGEVTIDGQTGFASATVRTEGLNSVQWIELETGQPLPVALRAYVVQAYKRVY